MIAFCVGVGLLWNGAPASTGDAGFIIGGALLAFVMASAWYTATIEALLIGIRRDYIRRSSKEGLQQAFAAKLRGGLQFKPVVVREPVAVRVPLTDEEAARCDCATLRGSSERDGVHHYPLCAVFTEPKGAA